ncbi:MAG TPA: FHA domain-containing protein [Anaerolineae bacterium]|nr:FHA domain-containing protein [Anaerolineae bacterium]
MIKCPACGQESMEGELVCSNCGTFLRTGGSLHTDPLDESEKARPDSGLAAPTYDTAPIGAALILKGQTDQREIVVPRKLSSVLFGRNDRLAGLMVDIDLTSEDGQTRGVSRRHARARFINDRYLIEDLESLNGTYLNRRKLVPFVPEVLHDGDELRFGSLTFLVVLKETEKVEGN